MTAETITVDGREYKVLVIYPSRLRSFKLKEGQNSGESISHRKIRDIGGTEYAYSMNISANPAYPEDYDAFYENISAPVPYHRVSMPYGQTAIEFDAAIYSGQDRDYGVTGDTRSWKELTIVFEPMEPQRRPE